MGVVSLAVAAGRTTGRTGPEVGEGEGSGEAVAGRPALSGVASEPGEPGGCSASHAYTATTASRSRASNPTSQSQREPPPERRTGDLRICEGGASSGCGVT